MKDGVAPPTKYGAPPTQVFMEKRVQQLEEVLAARDEEESKRLRALQQRYTAMEVRQFSLTIRISIHRLS